MRAPGLADDRVDDVARDERAVGICAHDLLVDDLFHHDDDAFGGERRLLLDAIEPPDLRVAAGIRSLRVDDGHIRIEGGNRRDRMIGPAGVEREALNTSVSNAPSLFKTSLVTNPGPA